jgi:hypothetical protein
MSSSPQHPVSDDRTVDTVLKSIRTKLRANRAGAADRAQSDDTTEIARLLTNIRQQLGQSSTGSVAGTIASDSVKSQDISRLDVEVGIALSAHRQVGQLNPRLPGLHNSAIQLAKKTMRRSLTWYTRPLQHFQGAVLRALQHVSTVLQSQGTSLHNLDAKVDNSASLCEQKIARIAGELEAVRSEVRALKEELRQVTGRSGDQQT